MRKVDFATYKSDHHHRDAEIIRRYVLQKPLDYTKYNRLCGSLRYVGSRPEAYITSRLYVITCPLLIGVTSLRQLAHKLAALEPDDPVRQKHEALLLEKLHDMGILGTEGAGGRGKLSEVEHKVTVSSFCRRRLGVVMTRLRMANTVQAVSPKLD